MMSRNALIASAVAVLSSAAHLNAQIPEVPIRRSLEEVRAQLEALDLQHDFDFPFTLGLAFDPALVSQEAALAMQHAELEMMHFEPQLAMAMEGLDLNMELAFAGAYGDEASESSESWQRRHDELEPAFSSLLQDPADSLWRAGREALNRGDFERAAGLFRQIRTEERFARSGYRAEAHYWEAFALARADDADGLRRAREILTAMQQQYPRSAQVRDAEQLAATIDGRLARTGDVRAAASLYSAVAEASAAAASARIADGRIRDRDSQCPVSEEEDVRIAALSALLNVDSDRTLPVLRDVMARRDACSAPLRRRALLLIARSRDPEAASFLVDVAQNDPDVDVRRSAVMMLGGVRTPDATAALESILRQSRDEDVQRTALAALAQQRGDQSGELLRDYALREDVSVELRRQAIFLLMNRRRGGEDDTAFLRELYGRTTEREIKQAVLAALGRSRSPESVDWLMSIAVNPDEPMDVRRQALFTASQSQSLDLDRLSRLYDEVTDPEFREQVLFALARRDEAAALDKLIAIARSERDLEMRKRAIFWLGNSKDPRAAEALLEILRQ